jgi:hypothetical protein
MKVEATHMDGITILTLGTNDGFAVSSASTRMI